MILLIFIVVINAYLTFKILRRQLMGQTRDLPPSQRTQQTNGDWTASQSTSQGMKQGNEAHSIPKNNKKKKTKNKKNEQNNENISIDRDRSLCGACLNARANMTSIPCRHMYFCKDCFNTYKRNPVDTNVFEPMVGAVLGHRRLPLCPICRAEIEVVIEVILC